MHSAFAGRSLALGILFALVLSYGFVVAPAKAAPPNDGPQAIIAPLPDVVSNGTGRLVDGRGSAYPGGTLINFTWTITVGAETMHYYWSCDTVWFKALGLYKITLTVTASDGKTDEAFTAVYSILDSDNDTLPDWWEHAYFDNFAQGAGNDPDGDGYTNLQEYAAGTNPTVKDPRPTLVQMMADGWYYLVGAAAVVLIAIALLWPKMKKKRSEETKKKIEAAIEIEKALDYEK